MSSVEPISEEQRKVVSRRDFLRVGSLSVVGLSVAEQAALAAMRDKSARQSCIFVLMTGGPSPYETFDPKPEAYSQIRGPLKAISTSVSGTQISESLPSLAKRAHKYALLRSLYHDDAPIHETGLQLLQTGHLARAGLQHPSFGSAVSHMLGPRGETAPYVVLPRLLGNTGVNAYRGQRAGNLGTMFDPLVAIADSGRDSADNNQLISPPRIPIGDEPESVRRAYGENRFGKLCLAARQLVENGVRCVTVNLFDSLANQPTWDCHGRAPWAPATLFDYRDTLCPQFDKAMAALLDDLEQRGLLEDTLVVAVGEMGRDSNVNEFGGRDHSTSVWSGLVAGAGIRGGQVVGASDAKGRAPQDRPIAVGELTATIYDCLGLPPSTPSPINTTTGQPLVDHAPISELFA